MKHLWMTISLLLSFFALQAFANEETKADIKLIMESHKMHRPGLYEIVSPTSGNVIYIFRDKANNMAMEVVKVESESAK